MSLRKLTALAILIVGIFAVGGEYVFAKDEAQDTDRKQTEEKIQATGVEPLLKIIKEIPGASEEPTVIGEGKLYTLGNEDVLEIIVRNQPEFSGHFIIGPDGKIQYNFVGDVQAAGFTKDQLKENLVKLLDKYVKLPEVSISIVAYMSKNVYVLGDVNKPGKYPMKGDNITLREAIIAADLPTRTAALRRCYIVTPDAKNPTLEKVDIFELLYKGKESLNCNLFPNQIVVVPSTIPSEINRALTMILSPASQYDNLDTIYKRQVENKETTTIR